ncbi:hypothetical protein [Streptomyces sp. CA2R101]|uniref:hypothetical protein n=1 Tax=Streptomyces sp. CA2R101 TaxID=3120152 RepID=UPI00300A8641
MRSGLRDHSQRGLEGGADLVQCRQPLARFVEQRHRLLHEVQPLLVSVPRTTLTADLGE